MSRLAYFKNVNPTVGLDATQNQMLNTLSGQIDTLTSGLALKADASALTSGLTLKADASALTSEINTRQSGDSYLSGRISDLNTDLGGQSTRVGIVENTLLAKADKTAVGLKLDTSVHTARVVNEAVFFDSVANSIVLQDANGVELNYVALGLVPA